jgi:hypothetical protein
MTLKLCLRILFIVTLVTIFLSGSFLKKTVENLTSSPEVNWRSVYHIRPLFQNDSSFCIPPTIPNKELEFLFPPYKVPDGVNNSEYFCGKNKISTFENSQLQIHCPYW